MDLVALPDANDAECPVWHVLQPKLVKWNDVLKSLAKAGLKFDEVDRREWVRLLRDSVDDYEKNPTKKVRKISFNSRQL